MDNLCNMLRLCYDEKGHATWECGIDDFAETAHEKRPKCKNKTMMQRAEDWRLSPTTDESEGRWLPRHIAKMAPNSLSDDRDCR